MYVSKLGWEGCFGCRPRTALIRSHCNWADNEIEVPEDFRAEWKRGGYESELEIRQGQARLDYSILKAEQKLDGPQGTSLLNRKTATN